MPLWWKRPRLWFFTALAVVLPVSALLAWFLVREGREKADEWSSILFGAVGAATVLVSLLVWLWRRWNATVTAEQLADSVRAVARQNEEQWAQRMRRALADDGDVRPANLEFRVPAAGTEPELMVLRGDGGPPCGTLRDVVQYYDTLQRGRLVILGESGAGKTVLARKLVLDLTRSRLDTHLDPESGKPLAMPVLLSLTSFDRSGFDVRFPR